MNSGLRAVWCFNSLALMVLMLLLSGCGGFLNFPPVPGSAIAPRGVVANSSNVSDKTLVRKGSPKDFLLNVGDRVFFTNDSARLSRVARETLDRQASWLSNNSGYDMSIEGHADERGTREYNLALGARRATAVRNYLIGKGVSSSRIKTISYGKERPVAVCDNLSCWSQNRRAVTVLKDMLDQL